MRIILGKYAGFCYGVREAINKALIYSNGNKKIYTFGELIHNKDALSMLEKNNIFVRYDINSFKEQETAIIRAHGIPKEDYEKLIASHVNLINGTCPYVIKVQKIIKKYSKMGYGILISGDNKHAEVRSLKSFADPNKVFIINSAKDLDRLPYYDKAILVSQTTQSLDFFRSCAEAVKKKYKKVKIFNTICDATFKRQQEAIEMAKRVDLLIVLGDKSSANSNRLAEISNQTMKKYNKSGKVLFAENSDNIDFSKLHNVKLIGITAGASTPFWIINNVITNLNSIAVRYNPFKNFFNFLLKSNIFIGFGGACISFSMIHILGLEKDPIFPLLTFLYFFSIYLFHIYSDRGSIEFSDPERIHFYNSYKKIMLFFVYLSAIFLLILTAFLGPLNFILMLFQLSMGMVYGRPIKLILGKRALHHIPGFKEIFIGIAWLLTIVLQPLISIANHDWGIYTMIFTKGFFYKYIFNIQLFHTKIENILIASIIVLFLSTCRSILWSLRYLEGDRVMGIDSLISILGKEKSEILIFFLSVFPILFFILYFHNINSLFLSLPFIYSLIYQQIFKLGYFIDIYTYEFIVDIQFFSTLIYLII